MSRHIRQLFKLILTLAQRTKMPYSVGMTRQKFIILLNERRKDWTNIAIKSGVSRRNIQRIAEESIDPRLRTFEKLVAELKKLK